MTIDMDKSDAVDLTAQIQGREKTIPLAEIFGPTIQGEGQLAGRPTYFVRVGGCDYKCDWCDTAHSVNPEEVRKLERKTVTEIKDSLFHWVWEHPGPRWLAISGGNPAMYDLSDLIYEWQRNEIFTGRGLVTVETQGSLWKPWLGLTNALTISPKPPSSGMPVAQSMENLHNFMVKWNEPKVWQGRYAYMERLGHWDVAPNKFFQTCLKVICFDETDYAFAQAVHETYSDIPFYLSCGTAMGGLSGKWVPPNDPAGAGPLMAGGPGDTPIDSIASLLRRYRWLVERAMNDPLMADVAVFPQIHALVWGISTRGV